MDAAVENRHEGSAVAAPGINPRETGLAKLDFASVFGNSNPVVLEIGSGKGRFLIDSGKARQDVNFLGVEKSLHYYRVIVKRLENHAMPNTRIVNYDALVVLRDMVPDASISEVHIYFPDPWPRKREQKRRLVRVEVAREILRVMRDDATGVYVSDHKDAFDAGRDVLASIFEVEDLDALLTPPRTNYEAKYRAQGRPIYEVRFRKRR